MLNIEIMKKRAIPLCIIISLLLIIITIHIIFSQNRIFNIEEPKVVHILDLPSFTSAPQLANHLVQQGHYNQNKINAYFVRNLYRINGIEIPGKIIIIADKTTVLDYSAASHGLGHTLRLQHAGLIDRLMAQGVNGFDLIDQEITSARSAAVNFI